MKSLKDLYTQLVLVLVSSRLRSFFIASLFILLAIAVASGSHLGG